MVSSSYHLPMFPLKAAFSIAYQMPKRAQPSRQNMDESMASSLLPVSATTESLQCGNPSALMGAAAPLIRCAQCHPLQMHDIQSATTDNATAMAFCQCFQNHYNQTMSKLLDEALRKTEIMDRVLQHADTTTATTLFEESHVNGAGVNPHGNDNKKNDK